MGSMVLRDSNLPVSLTPSVNASLELIINQGNVKFALRDSGFVPGLGMYIYHVQKQPNFFWSFYHGTSEGAISPFSGLGNQI
jgi:hypothetical protein